MMTVPSPSPASTWPLRVTAVVLMATGLVPMANLVTEGHYLKWWGPAVRQWIVWAVIITIAALVVARLLPKTCRALMARAERAILLPTPRVFAVLLFVATTGLALFFGWRLFHWQPVTIDELSQRWQASLLTAGRLSARSEAHGEFFSTMQTAELGGRWFSHFAIGGPALLSVGLLVGAPWLVNPLLVGVAAVAVYRFAAATTDELHGRAAAILLALSPFVMFIAASQLDHVGVLAAVWIAIAALPSWLASERTAQATRAAAVIGAALGVAAVIRPYDAALVSLVVALFQLRCAWRRRPLLRSLVVQVLVGTVPVLVLLLVNRATTGHPFTFAYDVLNGPEHRPGFHMSPLGFEHTPRHGLYLVSSYLMRLNIALLGWPVPALALVVATLGWQRQATRWDHLLLAILGVVLLGYAYYWGEGSFQGPRFLYVVAPVLLILTARLPAVLLDRVNRPSARMAVGLLVPLWLAVAWLSPSSTSQAFGVWSLSERARQHDSVTTLITAAAAERHLDNAVVFVPDGWHARLAARLRKLGARPFAAQLIVGHYDACTLQQLLDSAENTPSLAAQPTQYVFSALDQLPSARPVVGLSALEQLALTPGRALPPGCRQELERARSGVDFSRLLAVETLDSLGRLGGNVVYARDFGDRNELLRDRFGDRDWYRATVSRREGSLEVSLEPLARAPLLSSRR
jgi:4-amino-4-deoxy-L-arabinose transferase-like glycosyltransferase